MRAVKGEQITFPAALKEVNIRRFAWVSAKIVLAASYACETWVCRTLGLRSLLVFRRIAWHTTSTVSQVYGRTFHPFFTPKSSMASMNGTWMQQVVRLCNFLASLVEGLFARVAYFDSFLGLTP